MASTETFRAAFLHVPGICCILSPAKLLEEAFSSLLHFSISKTTLQVEAAKAANVACKVTLPDGSQRDAVACVTTPHDVALGISKSLAKDIVVAKVRERDRERKEGRNREKMRGRQRERKKGEILSTSPPPPPSRLALSDPEHP